MCYVVEILYCSWNCYGFMMGFSVFWLFRNPKAHQLYGYSATEAHGQNVVDLLVDPEDHVLGYSILNHTLNMRESWTGKFPTKTKRGGKLEVIATNSPFYDDNGNLIGVICVSNDSRPFEDMSSALLAAQKVEADSSVMSLPRRIASAKLGLDPQQPLQVAIASKISNLVSMYFNPSTMFSIIVSYILNFFSKH